MELKDIPEDSAANYRPEEFLNLAITLCASPILQNEVLSILDKVIDATREDDSIALFVIRDRKANTRTAAGWREDDVIQVAFWGLPEDGTLKEKEAGKYLVGTAGFVIENGKIVDVIIPSRKKNADLMQPPTNTH